MKIFALLSKDPDQMENVAAPRPDVVAKLDAELLKFLTETGDPRVAGGKLGGGDERRDKYPYYGR